jgi:hypothetical protein
LEIQLNYKKWVWKEILLGNMFTLEPNSSTSYTSLSIKEGSLFCLSHLDLPNHIVSQDVLGILGKPLMSMSAPRVFGSV